MPNKELVVEIATALTKKPSMFHPFLLVCTRVFAYPVGKILYVSLKKKCQPEWLHKTEAEKKRLQEPTELEKLAKAVKGESVFEEGDAVAFPLWCLAYNCYVMAMMAAPGNVPVGVLWNHYFIVRLFFHVCFCRHVRAPFITRCSVFTIWCAMRAT